jgi:SAM-dependent methyltransferase
MVRRMTVRWLPRVLPVEGEEPEPVGPDHPMRVVTREVASGADRWTRQRAAEVNHLFDELAVEWHTRDRPGRLAPVVDALERGGYLATDGLAVELGSGTGIATETIAARLPRLIAVDLSIEMLRLASGRAPRVRADGAHLPVADGVIATLLLVNMLLFPAEVDRVLATDGALVWVSTVGSNTPIYLSAEEVDAALPGDWDVVASEAGRGTWCVARRASTPSR